MLGNTLVTAQTGEAGRKVQTIYFTEAANLGKRPDGRDDEYYLAILLDRATSKPVIIASTARSGVSSGTLESSAWTT